MILQLEQVLNLGNPSKQRILFSVLNNGNLLGYHLFQGSGYLYSFPHLEVKKGEYVVLYLSSGERKTMKFHDAICHFLFYGERLRFWEEQSETFHLVFRTN